MKAQACLPASRPALHCVALATLGALAGCATGPGRSPADPLEPLNRVTWRVNDSIDRNVAQPVARGYNRVVPQTVRTGVGNFFANLGDLPVMLNDFAQLRVMDGMSDLMRVALNTTFGVLGLFDVATAAGIPKHDQDFGLTLAHYGVPSGPYLVLPLFGPSTFRDAGGLGIDRYATPVYYARPDVRNTLWGVNFVDQRARYLNSSKLLEAAALDQYLFVRDAWLAQRQSKVEGGKPQALPDYDAEPRGDAGARPLPNERGGDTAR